MGKKSLNTRKHDKFHVVVHEEWRLFMDRADVSAADLCLWLDVTRPQAVAMVRRKPRQIERLAMLALYHRLANL